ncbi:MAG: glycine cleavage system protein GcvH [Archangium sp.]|nr:glycine cleavage system protein GcvH [Archangium sp.]MDP3157883.1 glycine cleavage system protein GcvH [Archangium sp.]MDP3571875.1 glycine cleavage system protein GcvH [Archangium sp.]
MSNYPSDLKYTKDHEWAKKAGSNIVVGVTFHAQDALGAVVYVELPKVGSTVTAHASFGVIESTKAVSELFAPVTGKVAKINDDVTANPGSVNDDPYKAWLIEIEPATASDFDALLDQPTYVASLDAAK